MKIIRISLRNIASLAGTHTVDFTRDPLRCAGLFSISGATGSGKSTLLDALCLALYEQTPRLNLVRGNVRLADGGDTITQQHPGNLLRRGTGEGFAEVAFVAVDGKTYTARWAVRRARNRPEGALQNTEMTLFQGDIAPGGAGPIEQGGRKSEVLPVITAKVGLSFEQFTRAVLLAQNDFATFLKADDKDRAEILQALTGTERFEAISKTVYARCALELKAVSDIEARLQGSVPLSAEARAEADAAFGQAETALKEADERFAAREKHLAWFTRLAELATTVERAETALNQAKALRDNAAPRRLELEHAFEAHCDARPLSDAERRSRQELTVAEKVREEAVKAEAAARANVEAKQTQYAAAAKALETAKLAVDQATPLLRQARDLDSKLSPLDERLRATVRDRAAAEEAVNQATQKRDLLKKKRDAADAEREVLLPKRAVLAQVGAFAADVAAWLDRLNRASSARKTLSDAQAELARREKEEQKKASAAAKEREKEPALRTAVADALAALEKAEAAAREYDGEKIAADRRNADSARTVLRDLQAHLRDVETIARQVAELQVEIAKLNDETSRDGLTLTDLKEKRIPTAQLSLDAARRAYELAEAAVADAALRLREKLVPEHPCPVCGAVEHPYLTHAPASETVALRALRNDCAAQEKALNELLAEAAGLDKTCRARSEQVSGKSRSLETLTARLAAAKAVRHEHSAAVAILSLPAEKQAAALAERIIAEDETVVALDKADAARRSAEKQRDACRAAREKAAEVLASFEKMLGELNADLTKVQFARETAQTVCANAETELRICREELTPLFAGIAGAAEAWEADAGTWSEKFAADVREFRALEKREGELDSLIRETATALSSAQDALALAEGGRTAKQADEKNAREAYNAVHLQRAGIFAGRPADDMEAELNNALRLASETHETRRNERAEADQNFVKATEALNGATTAREEKSTLHTAAVAQLDVWLSGFTARTSRSLDRPALQLLLNRSETWFKEERAALEALDSAVSTAEGALQAQRENHAAHGATRPTEEDEVTVRADLDILRTAKDEAAQRRDAAHSVLLLDDQRRNASAELLHELEAKKVAALPWERLNELIGSADGAKFRSIAQRRTLDILLGYANAQLDLLAARYRLERIPESLNLIVIDRDMGDERRSVHSLSGGESFLVSLALALALASLTSNRLRIESLFIDEGFGSLDPETLNVAMGALMQLEAQGRKVGVISHVAEMADAIPVQIKVVKGRSGASKLVVPGAPVDLSHLSVASMYDSQSEGQGNAAVAAVATQILDILRRESAAGQGKVSVRALRQEIECTDSDFKAARAALAGQIRTEGKSLALSEEAGSVMTEAATPSPEESPAAHPPQI